MAETIACPQCAKPVKRHCSHCGWLQCEKCCVIFGKDNYFFYEKDKETKAKKQL